MTATYIRCGKSHLLTVRQNYSLALFSRGDRCERVGISTHRWRYFHCSRHLQRLDRAFWQAGGSGSPGNSFRVAGASANQRCLYARMAQRPPFCGPIRGRNDSRREEPVRCGLRVFAMRSGIIVPISQLHNSQNHTPLFRQTAEFIQWIIKVNLFADFLLKKRDSEKTFSLLVSSETRFISCCYHIKIYQHLNIFFLFPPPTDISITRGAGAFVFSIIWHVFTLTVTHHKILINFRVKCGFALH